MSLEGSGAMKDKECKGLTVGCMPTYDCQCRKHLNIHSGNANVRFYIATR